MLLPLLCSLGRENGIFHSIFSSKPLKINNDIMEINDIIPIENWIEEEALKGTLKLLSTR